MKLGEIRSRELDTLAPSATVRDAVKLMGEQAIRRLAVVEAGRAVGIVSLGDLAVERNPDCALAEIRAAPGNTRSGTCLQAPGPVERRAAPIRPLRGRTLGRELAIGPGSAASSGIV